MTLKDKAQAAYDSSEDKLISTWKINAIRAGISHILGEEYRETPIRRIRSATLDYAFDIDGLQFLCNVSVSSPSGKTVYTPYFSVNVPSGSGPRPFSDLVGLGKILSGD